MKIVSKSLLSRSSGYGILFYLLQIQKMKAKKKKKNETSQKEHEIIFFSASTSIMIQMFSTHGY